MKHSSIFNSEKKIIEFLQIYKVLLTFFASLFVILIALELILINTNIQKNSAKNSFPNLNKLNKALDNNTEILLFGDSTLHWVAPDEVEKKEMGDILQELIPDRSIEMISHGAYNPELYAPYLKYICRAENKPKVVVFTLNLRSYSVAIDLNPAWQFNEQISKITNEARNDTAKNTPLDNIFYRIDNLFNMTNKSPAKITNKTLQTYNGYSKETLTLYNSFDENKGNQAKARKYIESYMYEINPNNRKVIALQELVKISNECDIKTIIYSTPIDYKAGEKVASSEFINIVDKNLEYFDGMVSGNSKFLNLTYLLDSKDFVYEKSPNEHLTTEGKKAVAEKLGNSINEILASY